MNIINYVRINGDKSFSIFPFNEIDSLILSELSYMDFHLLFKDKEIMKIKDISREQAKEINKRNVDTIFGENLLALLTKAIRYQDIEIIYPRNIYSFANANQFAAYTFLLTNNIAYLSFRGTDTSLAGWKEDLYMTYMEVTLAQEQAEQYAVDVLNKISYPCYLGGHSKGGNLATYAALKIHEQYQARIIEVHSFDGPGFKNGINQFENYIKMKPKLIKYMTKRDLIGAFYNENENPVIIRASGLLLGGHDPFSWKIDENKMNCFMRENKRYKSSIIREKAFTMWMSKMPDEDKQLAVSAIFDIFKEETIYQAFLNSPKNVFYSRKSLANYTDEQKKRIRQFFKEYIRCYKEASKREWKN